MPLRRQTLSLLWMAALFVAGAAAALALPPWGYTFLAPIGFAGLGLWLEQPDLRLWRGAFMIGLVFGFGYFVMALQWIGNAFYVDAAATLWMMPFAVGGLALFLSLYWGAAAAVAHLVPRRILPRWVAQAMTLACAEWLRGHLLTGFPWAAPGLMVDGLGPVAQLASITGMTGLTLLVLLWGLAPLAVVMEWRAHRRADVLAVVVLLLLPVAWLMGTLRLAQAPAVSDSGPTVRLVQPNISQSEKWRDENSSAIFDTLLRLTSSGPAADLTVWPESSVPFFLDESDGARERIAAAIGAQGHLLAGAVRRSAGPPGQEPYFTSVMHVDGSGAVLWAYDKWRLVPGGEFLPYDALFSRLGFRKVVSLPESFTAGDGPHSFDVPGVGAVGPSICYEAIFPDRLVGQQRPDVLVNVTNDGWFGLSAGPHQHLAQARLRAIEQGLPLLRAANTGISAIVDPFGRIVARSPLGVETRVTGTIPAPLAPPIYAIWGDWMLLLLLAICTVSAQVCTYFERTRLRL